MEGCQSQMATNYLFQIHGISALSERKFTAYSYEKYVAHSQGSLLWHV